MIKQIDNDYRLNNQCQSVDRSFLSAGSIQISLIKDPNTLHQAQHLLYQCYIENMQWAIEQDNYSGIYVDRTSPVFRLIDDYDSTAHWFSVKQGNAMLGCARLCPEDTQGKLELERYPEATKVLWPDLLALKKKFRILELNREAITPHHPSKKTISFLLLQAIFRYCLLNHYAIITTSHLKEWMTLYDRIAFPTWTGCQFKYTETDLERVTVYFATEENIQTMHDKLCMVLE